MKKVLFAFNVDNVVDIITNSSSELFVLDGETREIVEEMIQSTYPGWSGEYERVKSTEELTKDELDTYTSFKYHNWNYNRNETDRGARYNEICGVEPKDLYEGWEKRNEEKYWYGSLSDSGAEKLKKAMDPDNKMWFLFSIDENPNWDRQEELMNIGTRYHLG